MLLARWGQTPVCRLDRFAALWRWPCYSNPSSSRSPVQRSSSVHLGSHGRTCRNIGTLVLREQKHGFRHYTSCYRTCVDFASASQISLRTVGISSAHDSAEPSPSRSGSSIYHPPASRVRRIPRTGASVDAHDLENGYCDTCESNRCLLTSSWENHRPDMRARATPFVGRVSKSR